MGYEIHFKPTKEFVDEKLKKELSFKTKSDEITIAKTSILIYCLGKDDDTRKTMQHLNFELRFLYQLVRIEVIQDAIETFNKEGEIWYCGWEYSKCECQWDLDDLTIRDAKQLTVLKLAVDTPNYFDNSERFYEKMNEIDTIVDGYEELCRDIAIYEVMGWLRPFTDKGELDEDDIMGGGASALNANDTNVSETENGSTDCGDTEYEGRNLSEFDDESVETSDNSHKEDCEDEAHTPSLDF